MISLFDHCEYEPNDLNLLADMRCTWSHAGTKLTLTEITWYRNVRNSFHLIVEEQHSSSPPVTLGINQGWDEIHEGMRNQIPPRELLAIVLRTNPEMEDLILRHSPSTEALALRAAINGAPSTAAMPVKPVKPAFWTRLGLAFNVLVGRASPQ